MSELENEIKYPAWHPLPVTRKHHAHIMALHAATHQEVTARNNAHDELMASMRKTNPQDLTQE